MTDILCIIPPYSYEKLKDVGPKCPNLGVATIAAYLQQNGYSVKILDAFALELNMDQIKKEIISTAPKIVLSGGSTAVHPNSLKIFEAAKKINHNVETIYGGPHVTNQPETAIINNSVDFIVIGEGEITSLELIDYIFGKKNLKKEEIKGICYKNKEKIIFTEKRPLIKNLDILPIPAYHLLPMGVYEAYGWYDTGRKFTTMISSRGCPSRCSFCISSVNFNHWWRARSAEKVFEEIKLLYDKYGIRHIYFQDDDFCVDPKRVIRICDMIKENNLDIVWECLTRVNPLDEELIKKMAECGCKSILFGAEVGYEEGFKKINKPVNLSMVLNAVKLAQKYKIMTKVTFILGFPWESEKEIKETIKFAKKLDADLTFFNTLTPYPGTVIYNEIKENNLFVEGHWSQYETHSYAPLIRTQHLTHKQISYWIGRAYLEMYLRPSFLIRRIKNLTNFKEFKRNFNSARGLLELSFKKLLTGK